MVTAFTTSRRVLISAVAMLFFGQFPLLGEDGEALVRNRARQAFAKKLGVPRHLAVRDLSRLPAPVQAELAEKYNLPMSFFEPDRGAARSEQERLQRESLKIRSLALTLFDLFPDTGTINGGTTVFIDGKDIEPGATVTFGGVAGTNVDVDSCTDVDVRTPAHAAGTVDVVVSNPSGTTFTLPQAFTFQPELQIDSVNPSSGPVAGGTHVTITGANFQTGISVTFDFRPATSVNVISPTTLTAVTPAGDPGFANVRVSRTGFISDTLSNGFLYLGPISAAAPPTISSFSPMSGPPGTVVTINGNNFGTRAFVLFPDPFFSAFASPTSITNTQIMVSVPQDANSGPITVETSGGVATTCNHFTITSPGPPTITGVNPTPLPQGDFVEITGTNFNDVRQVFVAGVPQFFFVFSSTGLEADVAASAQSGVIQVISSAGTGTSQQVTIAPFTDFCTTAAAPTITSFTPTTVTPGQQVTVTGTGFRRDFLMPGTGETFVLLLGTQDLFASVDSVTQLRFTVPAGAQTGPITVFTDYGIATSSTNLTVTHSMPVIVALFPQSGNPGVDLEVNAGGAPQVTQVRFDGAAGTADDVVKICGHGFFFECFAFGTTLVTEVPINAVTGPITLISPAGNVTSTGPFTVTCAPPTITDFNPTSGTPGTNVTITGTNLLHSPVTFGGLQVSFNGGQTTGFGSTGTSLNVNVPSTAMTGPITVTNPYGSATSSSSFTVNPGTPAISSFSPTSGAPGTSVTIRGTNLNGATAVTFGGVAASSITIQDATALVAVVPNGAMTGPIGVTTPGGTATSGTNIFTVTSAAPTITGFAPATGPAGTTVTITGTNFTGATAVRFNNVTAQFTVQSPTVITATVPSGVTTGPISVTTPNGTAQSSTNFVIGVAGDVNGDGAVNASDVMALIQALFGTGQTPPATADANGDGVVDILDLFYLIHFVYVGGPAPQ